MSSVSPSLALGAIVILAPSVYIACQFGYEVLYKVRAFIRIELVLVNMIMMFIMFKITPIMQIKNIMDSMAVNKNDPRTNLLLSLKPYMCEGRKHSIDSAVRLLGLTNVTKMLKK